MGYTPSSQAYATRADLPVFGGLSAAALSSPNTPTAAQDAALLTNSELADSYLRQQFTLPLVAWGADLKKHVVWMAAYDLMCLRGFNPNNVGDVVFLDRYKMALDWFKLVANGVVSPDVTDSSPSAGAGVQAPDSGPVVVSAAPFNSTQGKTRGTGSR